MASSENQGLQIALIVFVMLTIVLGVFTFIFFRSYQEEQTKNQSLAETSSKNKSALDAAIADMSKMKVWIGVPDGTTIAELDGDAGRFKKDMDLYAATLPAERRHYRDALEQLSTAHGKALMDLVAAKDEIASLKTRNEMLEANKAPQIAEHDKRAADAEKDRDQLKSQFDQDRTAMKTAQSELAAKVDTTQKAQDSVVAKANQQVAMADAEKKNIQSALDAANFQLSEFKDQGFEVPDGKILRVDQVSRSVWVDVGHADKLRKLISFSVYNPDANYRKGEGRKGSIEITSVLNEHLAVGRIVDDELSNPMVAGDLISTSLWQPGRGEHFAIIGTIDLDGDKKDDRQVIRDMITMAGGEVDAEVDAEGKQTGSLGLSTRYLLRGEISTDKAMQQAFQQITREADNKGVQEIEITKFLDLVGWKDPQQVLRFGTTGNADRLRPPQPDGGQRVIPDSHLREQFKKRRPPSATTSAYSDEADKAEKKPATPAPAKAGA